MLKEYNPKTAFGNSLILKLFRKIKQPNKHGYFEVVAGVGEKHVYDISWQCVECGRWHEEEIDTRSFGFDFERKPKRKCATCGAKHLIDIDG